MRGSQIELPREVGAPPGGTHVGLVGCHGRQYPNLVNVLFRIGHRSFLTPAL